jgi:predicted nucleotidyltransferase
MSNINIKPKHLKQIGEILKKHIPNSEVWAYGSRVRGASHDGSDLDLVVRNPSDLNAPIDEIFEVKEAFEQSNIPFLVDILDWARLPESFQEEILKDYVIVQGKKNYKN